MFAAYDSKSPPNPFLKAEFVKAVTAQLRDPNREARREAMDFLRSIWHKATSETVAGLIATLQDENTDVRTKSIAMLGEIGPQARPAVPSLLALLNDKSVSAEAAEALRQIDSEAAERAGVK
jgi:HEAT repeat protein